MSWIALEKLEQEPEITAGEVGAALDAASAQVIRNLPEFTHCFQKAYSEDGFYQPTENRNLAGLRAYKESGAEGSRRNSDEGFSESDRTEN